MLVLSRKPGESVLIGAGITITVREIRGGKVRLAIEAPGDVLILREELAERADLIERWRERASGGDPAPR